MGLENCVFSKSLVTLMLLVWGLWGQWGGWCVEVTVKNRNWYVRGEGGEGTVRREQSDFRSVGWVPAVGRRSFE